MSGPAAYDEWAAVPDTGAPEKVDYFGNSYVSACKNTVELKSS